MQASFIKTINRISTSIITCVLLFFICLNLVSCNSSGSEAYNTGYKEGYHAGYTAATQQKQPTTVAQNEITVNESSDVDEVDFDTEKIIQNNPNIPQKAILVLKYIHEHHKAPEGYVGGRTFGNYENHLPKLDDKGRKIKYQEWDIHPKVDGKNRGAQRLVTGSDERAWYTADHYNSFSEINLE